MKKNFAQYINKLFFRVLLIRNCIYDLSNAGISGQLTVVFENVRNKIKTNEKVLLLKLFVDIDASIAKGFKKRLNIILSNPLLYNNMTNIPCDKCSLEHHV